MGSKFKCFVQINEQKFDINFNEKHLNLISFEDIYHKIQDISQKTFKEVVDFKTHEFVLFDEYSKKGSVLRVFSELIANQSVIHIKHKPKSGVCPLVANHTKSASNSDQSCDISQKSKTFSPNLKPSSDLPSNGFIKPETSPPKELKNEFQSLKSSDTNHNYYCDVCPVVVIERSDIKLLKNRYVLSDEDFDCYSKLLAKITDISDNKLSKISIQVWNEVIDPYMLSIDKKCKPMKKWRMKYQYLLKKYVEVLRVTPNRVIACNLFPFFHHFDAMDFDSNECFDKIDFKEIIAFRERMSRYSQFDESVPNISEVSEEQKDFKIMSQLLIECKEEVKEFNAIVMAIKMGVNYLKKPKTRKGLQVWQQICDELAAKGYKPLTPSECWEKFQYWLYFYAQNYNRLNNKLEQNLQKTFDLLKVSHILDLNLVINGNKNISKQMNDISEGKEFKDFYDKHLKCIEFEKCTEFLANNEKDIKNFHSLVINLAKLPKPSSKGSEGLNNINLFKQLSQRMIAEEGFEDYNQFKCEKQLKTYIKFYAQNFDLLDGKLDERHQNIFNLFKIIHILDLKGKVLFNEYKDQILEISSRKEVQNFCQKNFKHFIIDENVVN